MASSVQAAAVNFPPGFRFRPSDEEIVGYYLKNKVHGNKFEFDVIREIDLYKCEPWDLPEVRASVHISVREHGILKYHFLGLIGHLDQTPSEAWFSEISFSGLIVNIIQNQLPSIYEARALLPSIYEAWASDI